MSEAPATPAPAGDAPPEPSTTPPAATPPADAPPATPPASTEGTPPAADDSSSADLGDGPDGDPVDGESDVDKFKRIARREQREKREAIGAATTERDQAVTTAAEATARAETAEQALEAAKQAAEKLPEVEKQVETLTATVAERDTEILRYKVAAQKGLTLAQADRLKGSTADEIAADADKFIADNAMPGTPPGGGQRNDESNEDFVARMNRNR